MLAENVDTKNTFKDYYLPTMWVSGRQIGDLERIDGLSIKIGSNRSDPIVPTQMSV